MDNATDGIEELVGPLSPREGIGGNNPPSDAEVLRDILLQDSQPLLNRRDELLGSVSRAPLAVEDEETCGKVADLVKLLTACHKNAEATRVAKKEPFLQQGRVVDGFFKQITDPLEKARKTLEPRLTKYQRDKADRERREREAAQRAAEEEARRKAAEAAAAAQQLETEEDLDAAIAAEQQAKQAELDKLAAQKAAEAKAAELSRSRGDFGAVASLRTFWDHKDLDRATLDLEALRPFFSQDALEKAVRAYVRANFEPGKPGTQIKGVVIFENTTTRVA